MTRLSSTSYEEKRAPYTFEVILPQMSKSSAIKTLIEDSGMSYREIESQSGGAVSFNQVSAYSAGKETNPTLTRIVGLAKALGLSPVTVLQAFLGEEAERTATYPEFLEKVMSDYQKLGKDDREELAPSLEMLNNEIQRRLKSRR